MPNSTILLLVEDDPLIQELLEVALTEAGFEVTLCSSGEAALALLSADPTRFRALITDINLGVGPDGWDVARHGRALVPELPLVYMSGHSADDWSSKGVPNSIMTQKPFAAAQIVTAVANLLNKADTHGVG